MLSAFRDISIATAAGQFAIAYNGRMIPVYSERSGARDVAELTAAIAGAPEGFTTLIIAPYAEALAAVFAAEKNFVFIAPVNFAAQPLHDARLIADDAALAAFINSVGPGDKFRLYLLPRWREALDYVASCARGLLEQAAVRLKTIDHFEKLWQINFRVNAPLARQYRDITALLQQRPDTLVMAGPSLDHRLGELGPSVWCADTALPVLLRRQVVPRVVFSVDAGFASREHFVGCLPFLKAHQVLLVCDLLGYPAVQRLPFSANLSYASSHPLVQEFTRQYRADWTRVENPRGDVGSLMRAVHAQLFPGHHVHIVGHDGRHLRYVTHARGTAYFTRSYAGQSRLTNSETYMLKLSRRYA